VLKFVIVVSTMTTWGLTQWRLSHRGGRATPASHGSQPALERDLPSSSSSVSTTPAPWSDVILRSPVSP